MNEHTFIAENEVRLLQPVSFILQIKRNLSTSWYHEIPDIEMSGRLKSINVLLNQEDYAMIMATLTENLGEIVEDVAPTPQVSRAERKQTLTGEPSKMTICK